MPHALLLSPDDQAVSAITAVLEEMSVTCERPLDGPSAAQQLHSHRFDLVLVDCENLPAAKLILDVCRRGTTGKNPVPMAIIDGHASLPTAFRLGADLILTKPVARDQARNAIRTAISRVRKDVSTKDVSTNDVSTNDVSTKDSFPAPAVSTAQPDAGRAGEHEQAAATAAVSSQLTSFSDAVPDFVSTPAAHSASATRTAPTLSAEMHSAIDKVADDEAETEVKTASPKLRTPSASPTANSRRSEPRFSLQHSRDSDAARPDKAEPAKSKQELSQPPNAAPNPVEAEWRAALFESYQQRRRRMRLLLALLMLTIAGGGSYAAWMYQPSFRVLAQPQINRMLKFAGTALPQRTKPDLPSPAPNRAPNPTPAPSSGSPAGSPAPPTTIQSTSQSSTAGSSTGSTTSSATKPATSAVVQPSVTLPIGKATATSSASPIAGEGSAIVLTAKGAEKRLEQRVPPTYPAEARAEGTVFLKEVVDENGKVVDVRLLDGNAALATAAIKAVKQWRYRPYIHDGKAESFQTVVVIDFQRP
jgi:TonB family protein